MVQFDSKTAFSRNIGWITSAEAEVLSKKRVAIAGMGGVGGHYAEVLTRLGIKNFTLADFDSFELANFNRQNGSGVSTLGQKKLDVIAAKIRDINPEADIKTFPEGINTQNIDQFLSGVDLYCDGLDFFVLTERLLLFSRLRELNIHGVTVAPVGMGASLMVFAKDSMSFEKYFGYTADMETPVQAAHFLAGMSPSMLQRHYFIDSNRASLKEKKTPSTPMGCYLCAGVVGTMAVKILLGRGEIKLSPWSMHFDAYLQTYKKKYIWLGASNPLQRLKLWYIKKTLLNK